MKEYNYKIKGAPYNVKINDIEENIAKVEVNGIEFEVELEKPVAQPKPVVRAVAAPVKTIEAPKAAQEAVAAGVSAVRAPLPGTINDIKVIVGQAVKKGQTMFIIDQVPYQAALNTAEAALKAAQAQEATSALNYESRKKLFDQEVVSEFDMQTAHNSLLTAKASVAQAEAQVVNARNSLSYTVVKSPADGVVGTLPYRQGALVGPSMPKSLTTVSDNNQMWVYFSMNESQFLAMTRQSGSAEDAVAAMPEVSLQLVDGSMYELKGRVESASGVVDQQTGSVQLRAVFDNPNHILHSGSTGKVIIPTIMKDVLTIPTTAAVQMQDKFRVYAVDKDGAAHGQVIAIMPQNDGKQYIVTSGLEEGTEIVAEGATMVKEDQVVKNVK